VKEMRWEIFRGGLGSTSLAHLMVFLSEFKAHGLLNDIGEKR